jgi:spermidine synthase
MRGPLAQEYADERIIAEEGLVLNAIVFACGAALMSLELVATRVLAPAMGSSIYVWGSVISIVMLALSLGYWLGGQLADRYGAARALAPVIAAAGLLTVAAPLVAEAALPWAAGLGPRLGSLVAAMLIFFAPSLLLAMVSPLGVRLAATRGLDHIGRTSGNLYAVSTAGSIFGTLTTAFWLIPLLSLEPLIVGTGFLLGATSIAAALWARALDRASRAGFVAPRVNGSRTPAAVPTATYGLVVGSLLLGSIVLWQAWAPAASGAAGGVGLTGETVLLRKDTQYHRITVTQDATSRHLRFDKSHQSAMDLKDPFSSHIRYPDYMQLAMAIKPDAKRVLVIGLGGATITKRFWHDYPGVSVDTVEIDPAVVDIARKYFALPTDSRIRVVTEDGRRFVQTTRNRYDIVVVDAYYADALPFHLTTTEFFREVKARLAPDGVVAYNVIGSVTGDSSRLLRSMYRTESGIFGKLWLFPIGLGDDGMLDTNRNVIVLATDRVQTKAELTASIASRVSGIVKVPGFPAFSRDLYTGPVDTSDVPTLTDSHAPTDSLIKVN